MAQRLRSVEVGNHIIAVYPDSKSKFDEAFEFLKPGLERNEVVMLITEDMTKDEIRARMQKEWGVDVARLEEQGDIVITTNSEWYFPDGMPNKERTVALWQTLVDNSMMRGKRGLRVVGDTMAFFKHNLSKELLEYETALERQFSFPFTAICAYDKEEVQKNYTKEEFDHIRDHHNPEWIVEQE